MDVNNGTIETQLQLFSFVEDGVTIIYSPALDLNGSGYDLNQAKSSFWETLTEFFRYTTIKKTLVPELKRLGWTVKGTKKVTAPDLAQMMRTNLEFKDILENKEYRKFHETVQIPQLA
jgi:hypothetical protein